MKTIFKKIIDKFKDTTTTSKLDWILFLIISVFLFSCYIYIDMLYTVSHANNIFTAILKGDFLGAYKVNYGFFVDGNSSTICYELPIYIFFIIWNIPVWIMQNFFNVDIINNIFSILWMKGLLVAFLFACSYIVQKICEELRIEKNKIKWIILIFVSSPLVFSSLFMLSQYDVIPLFFILLGTYCYMKKDYKKFILWFAIAIPLKLFAIFAFIPMILLKEKKVLKIFRDLTCGVSVLAISKLLSSFMPYYTESTTGFNNGMLNRLLSTSVLNINLGSASLFFIVYFLFCIFCYIKVIKSDDSLKKYSIYIPFTSFFILFLLILYHPFWLIYTTPFFALLLFLKPKYFKVNLLLDIAMSVSALISQIYYFYWCFSAKQVNNMLIPYILGFRTDYSMTARDILEKFEVSKYMPAALALYCASVITMIIINRPKEKELENSVVEQVKVERSVVWARTLIIVPVAIIMIFCYYI